jgi:hypothetical protein
VTVDAGPLRRRRDDRLLVGGQAVSLAGSAVVAGALAVNALLPEPRLWSSAPARRSWPRTRRRGRDPRAPRRRTLCSRSVRRRKCDEGDESS